MAVHCNLEALITAQKVFLQLPENENVHDPNNPLFIQALLFVSAYGCILGNCCGFFTD